MVTGRRLCSMAIVAPRPRKTSPMTLPHPVISGPIVLLIAFAPARVMAEDKPGKPSGPPEIAVRYIDGSLVRLTLLDDRLEIVTPEGTRSIPVSEIRKVDLGLRISDEQSKRIDAAIKDLGSAQAKTREEASKRLLGLRELAYPALKRAAQAGDSDAARRAESLIEKL